jgi:manganese/zinc/iron transport system ATP- binding protein
MLDKAVEIEDLTVAYLGHPALWDVDASIPRGSLSCILGPNGAGKSTLLKAALGLLKISAGRIRLLGQSIQAALPLCSYVPQRSGVDWDFPITVLEVARMGTYGRLGLVRRPGKKETSEAMEALERLQILELANRPIGELSGGQQQRCFLARALVQNAELYFLDEPFQGIDAHSERVIVEMLKDLRSKGKTIVVVHHDLQTVKEYFDYAILLNVRLIDQGPTSQVVTFENLKTTYGGTLPFLRENNHD